jgi:hypothetical protein
MNFEDQIISFKPKPLIDDPIKMESLLRKANDVDIKRPKLNDFNDVYSSDEIKRDELLIQKRKDEWKEQNSDYEKFVRDFSSIYEASVIDLLHTNKFLGEDTEVIPTSKYDDIFNGIDGVFIINQKKNISNYLGLNMDVTYSSGEINIDKKIDSIKQCIREGELPTLKYFQDPKTKEHKKISLPKIIIGSQQSSADGLIRLWGQTTNDNSEKLKNHPIQSKIIMEALSQLMYFYKFAKNLAENTRENKMREKYENITLKYGQMYNYFLDIYHSKKDLIESHYNEIMSDSVYKEIIAITEGKK